MVSQLNHHKWCPETQISTDGYNDRQRVILKIKNWIFYAARKAVD